MSIPLASLPLHRLRLLAALGHPDAKGLISAQPLLRSIDRADARPSWEVYASWLDELRRIDSTAILAAGIVVGERLLQLCEPDAYSGDLERIVTRLRSAWQHSVAPVDPTQLQDMAERVLEMNVAECKLDSGGDMPSERTAARAMTHVGLQFSDSAQAADWLANAVEGLEVAGGLERDAIEDLLVAGIIRLVLLQLTTPSGVQLGSH